VNLLVIDASNQAVVPGLFEMHAHMAENSEVQGHSWLSYGITTGPAGRHTGSRQDLDQVVMTIKHSFRYFLADQLGESE